jgi:hypothetical protein
MRTFILPNQLAQIAGGQKKLQYQSENLRTMIEDLCTDYPAMRTIIFDGKNNISPFIGVFVDGEQIFEKNIEHIFIRSFQTVQFISAIAGG